jgi:hypothetical protein
LNLLQFNLLPAQGNAQFDQGNQARHRVLRKLALSATQRCAVHTRYG